MLAGTFFAGLLITAYVTWYDATHGWYSRERYRFKMRNVSWGLPFFGLLGSFLAAFLLAFLAGEVTSDEVTVKSDLASLQDGSSLSGSFFLGSGSIDEDPAFFYYQETDGGFRLRHRDASDVLIKEYNGAPYMEEFCTDYNTMPDWVYWPLPYSDKPDISCTDYAEATFYVPEGSIKNNFNLDAR